MNNVKLLDCTLRDGAYLVDMDFGEKTMKGMIAGLVKSKIDFIEIGFLEDTGGNDGHTVYLHASDADRYVPADKGSSEFAVLVNFSRYTMSNLEPRHPGSIDGVRMCFFKNERYDVIEACRDVKEKGYKVFVQPVDILGYSDAELIEFIGLINTVEPYCLSIVDTFGSMYQEDLHRVYELINHNLVSTCRIGFHSHNNMQLSNALSQEFVRISLGGGREVIVDGTISGMGRGAGNTPTELIVQYMVSRYGAHYDIDAILDIIDTYMDGIRARCSWGYNTEYFIAGCFGAHVNNIYYLDKKNSLRSKDVRYILNKIGAVPRKRYDYDLLEKTYLEFLNTEIDDGGALEKLKAELAGKDVLLLLPGETSVTETDKIDSFISEREPVIITVNFLHDRYRSDYLYISNVHRYHFWEHSSGFADVKKIITSNINTEEPSDDTYVVSFMRLIKCGWERLDNAGIMALRLLDILGVNDVSIAGFDGYRVERSGANYAYSELELSSAHDDPVGENEEILDMLKDFASTKHEGMEVRFVTTSRFEGCFI